MVALTGIEPEGCQFDSVGVFPWIAQLRNLKRIPFPDSERDAVLAKLLDCAVVPPLELDEALQFEERRTRPRLGLRIVQQKNGWGEEHLQAHLLLDYGTRLMPHPDTDSSRSTPPARRKHRDYYPILSSKEP